MTDQFGQELFVGDWVRFSNPNETWVVTALQEPDMVWGLTDDREGLYGKGCWSYNMAVTKLKKVY